MAKKKRKKKASSGNAAAIGGVLLFGFLLLGIAFGAAIDDRMLGIYIGIGLGIVAMVIVWFALSR